ncbi:transcription initiation factor tfiid subunit [Anaeramoeba flamelloides]|uniref:Transcription initiation factor tfiid subunit n=1 Tax=Anaeramoeba flamelloides TaxID=1746091 RepID=A0AAV8A1T3_9EUKA|nr:transcription initiation factor tfiid subunit [Anaeramoeba flamelloides]
MFISKKQFKKKIKYNPRKHSVTLKLHKESEKKHNSRRQQILDWVSEILHVQTLTMEEAFRNDWIHLLNLVNVISPCQYNKVVNTTSSSMQRMKNLEEYQRTLKFCKYKYMNDFAADEFLKDELSREALIQLIRSLLYLKKRYEMIGVRKDKSQEIRSFYVLSTDEADCYNSIQEESLQENVKIDNVFWLDHKKRLESFQKNQEEEEKESEKKKDSNVSSSSFSKSSSMSPLSSSEGNEGIQETKDENQKDQVKKVEKAKNKTSSGSSSNSSNSGSGIEFSDETQKKTEKEKVDQKETKKKNKETITKKNKSSSGSSSNSSSSSSRENEDSNENNQETKDESQKDQKKKVEKSKNKTSSGSSSNPSSSSEENGKETNNKRKGKEKEQEKGMEMETKQKNKEENEKSTKVPSTSEEGNENKTQKEVKNPKQENGSQTKKANSSKKTSDKDSKNKKSAKDQKKKKKRKDSSSSNSSDDNSSSSSSGETTSESESETTSTGSTGTTSETSSLGDSDSMDSSSTKRRKKFNKSTKRQKKKKSKYKTKKKKKVTRELKLAKGEHLYEILAYNSSNTEYFSRNLQEIFKIKNKNPNKYWYIYSVFFILNYLDEWRKQGNTNLLRGIRDKALGKKYEKFVQRAYSDAQDFAKNGKAIFKCFIGEPNSQTFREGELKILKKGIVISLTNMKGHFYKKKLSESMTFSLHKTDPFVISYEILKPPKCFPIKFQSEFDKILAIMTLIYFIKNRGDKRKIGHNPYNMTAHPVIKRVLPPLEIPNERFKKLISGTDYVNMKGNAKEILAKYYSQRGVNFLIAIVNIKEYPLVSGYIKVRENEIKIGCNKTTLFKVPFTHKPILMKNPNDSKVFLIRWTQNAMCGTSSEPAVSVMCKAVSERSLITKSIMYFIKNWQDKEKIKRNKKKSKKKDRKQRK